MKQIGGYVKITGGTYRGRSIQTPGGNTHPMGERERLALFNMIFDCVNDSQVLDLFCGGGTLGIEALSRGAKSVTFVDNSGKVMAVVKKNCLDLEINSEKWKTVVLDANSFAMASKNQYDLVLADPPYDTYTPEMVENLPKLVKQGGTLVLSHPGAAPDFSEMQLLKARKYANANLSIYIKR
ncbi:RsmD family RNA methyltransferase [Candidatus Saccharibacteria bacterium]|nr:RsmD family RNA methyltransferase [Candidatus Saccharibacteria bacterium]